MGYTRYCSNGVTYFLCSDPSKKEMKCLWERFPLGKNRNRSLRIRLIPDLCTLTYFVLFLTSDDGSIALSVSFSKIACCIQYGITPETTYRLRSSAGSCFDGRKIMAWYVKVGGISH